MGSNCSCNPMNRGGYDPRDDKSYYNTQDGTYQSKSNKHESPRKHKKKSKKASKYVKKGKTQSEVNKELLKTLETVGPLMPDTPKNNKPEFFGYTNEELYSDKPQITAGNDDHDMLPPIPGHSYTESGNNELIGQQLYSSPVPTPMSILSNYNVNNMNNINQQTSNLTTNNNRKMSMSKDKDTQSIADSQHSKRSRVSSRKEEIQQMKKHIANVSSSSNLAYPLVSAMDKHSSQVMLDPGFDPQKHNPTLGFEDEEDEEEDDDTSNSGSSSINTADQEEINNRKTEIELKKELQYLKETSQPHIIDKTDNDDEEEDEEDDNFDEDYLDDNEINSPHTRQVIRAQSTAQWTTKAVNELHEDMEKQFKDLLARESMRQQNNSNNYMQYTPNNISNFPQQQPPLYLPIMEEAQSHNTFSQHDNKSIHSNNLL